MQLRLEQQTSELSTAQSAATEAQVQWSPKSSCNIAETTVPLRRQFYTNASVNLILCTPCSRQLSGVVASAVLDAQLAGRAA